MKIAMAIVTMLGLLAASPYARADLINFGTAEAVSIRYCDPGASGCDVAISPAIQIIYGGSPGALASSATTTLPALGTASGSVALSGTIGAPVLMASATSEAGIRTNTNSVALQSYTYTGSEATTRTFSAELTYSQMLTGVYPPQATGMGIYAAIAIFTLSTSMIDVGSTPASNLATLIDPESLPGYTDLGTFEYNDPLSTDFGSANFGVTIPISPGDTVWVWVLLQTPAPNGSFVDASHTLRTNWDNPFDLVPAVSVPEPGTLALTCTAILLLGWRTSRRAARDDGAPRTSIR